MQRTGRFGRSDRLLRSQDFRRIQRGAQRVASRGFVILLVKNPVVPGRRLGITASRKVGNAVVRNRVKRRVREWFRRVRGSWPDGLDLVVIARKEAAALRGNEMWLELDRMMAKALGEPR